MFLCGQCIDPKTGLELQSIGSIDCNCLAAGSGVTFVLTGTTPAQTGKFKFSSIINVSLRAPSDTSYDYPGVLIYVNREAPNDESVFESIENLTFNGAIYAASHKLKFASVNYTSSTDCLQIVGHQAEFSSMDTFGRSDNCAAYGARKISVAGGAGGVRLTR